MKRLLVAFVLCLPAFNVDADRPVGISISGTDQYCNSYTPTVVGSGTVLTCVPGGVTPGAPTNCVATVNSATNVTFAAAGGTVNLSVACTETSGVTYNWARNGTFGYNTARQWSEVLPANASPSTPVTYTYQVRPCIGANCVTVPVSALVATVAPTGGFSGSCPGFTNTYVLDINWASPTRQYALSMGPNDMVLVRTTTGNISSTTSLPRIAGAEYNSPPSNRIATLSTTPCDFTQQAAPGANMQGNSITAIFALGSGSGYGFYPVIGLNTVLYLSVKNSPNSTCAGQTPANCGMFFDLLKPGL
jgi:hypothetical protein